MSNRLAEFWQWQTVKLYERRPSTNSPVRLQNLKEGLVSYEEPVLTTKERP